MALTPTESQLINRAVHREPEAFSDLYLKYQPIVLRHIYYLVGNMAEAEDLTSETFLRAWNSIGRFQERGLSIRAWLLKIGLNLRHDHFRRSRRAFPATDLAAFGPHVVDPDPWVSPDLVVEASLHRQALRAAISTLPNVQRKVIILRFLNELSYTEIQSITGKSPGAIRVIQHRALKALQRLLRGSDFEVLAKRTLSDSLEPAPASALLATPAASDG